MRRRWKVKDEFWLPMALATSLGWLPLAILGQALTAPHGLGGALGWGFFAGVGVVWGPPLLWGMLGVLRECVRFIVRHGVIPFHRVSEPVTTDLRETL